MSRRVRLGGPRRPVDDSLLGCWAPIDRAAVSSKPSTRKLVVGQRGPCESGGSNLNQRAMRPHRPGIAPFSGASHIPKIRPRTRSTLETRPRTLRVRGQTEPGLAPPPCPRGFGVPRQPAMNALERRTLHPIRVHVGHPVARTLLTGARPRCLSERRSALRPQRAHQRQSWRTRSWRLQGRKARGRGRRR